MSAILLPGTSATPSNVEPLYLGGTDFIRTGPDGLSTAIVGFVDATPAM